MAAFRIWPFSSHSPGSILASAYVGPEGIHTCNPLILPKTLKTEYCFSNEINVKKKLGCLLIIIGESFRVVGCTTDSSLLLIQTCLGLCDPFLVVTFLETEKSLEKVSTYYIELGYSFLTSAKFFCCRRCLPRFFHLSRSTEPPALRTLTFSATYDIVSIILYLKICVKYICILWSHDLDKVLMLAGLYCLKNGVHTAIVAFDKPKLIPRSRDSNIKMLSLLLANYLGLIVQIFEHQPSVQSTGPVCGLATQPSLFVGP